MSEEKQAKTALKKSDLLSAVRDNAGKTAEQIERKLAKSHTFIPEFLQYLMAMYIGNGKIGVDDEGILSIKETGQIRTEPRPIFKLDEAGTGFEEKMLAPGDKLPEFWSLTKNTAVKAAKKEAYSVYKARVKQLEDMAASGEADVVEAEAA